MRSAGLKNITARHLALASQSLSLMISLIPYVREALRRHLRAKQAVILVDFDKVKRDFQEHQYEIHSKLVAIMADRLAVHCQTLLELNWNSSSASTDGKPQAYMETLVKETTTLHKVLLRYLPPSSLETVMMQVLSQIGARLAEEYGKIELKSEAAKHRMLVDAQYLKAKFAELKGFERPLPAAVSLFLSLTAPLTCSAGARGSHRGKESCAAAAFAKPEVFQHSEHDRSQSVAFPWTDYFYCQIEC